jgi:hypothetical protein
MALTCTGARGCDAASDLPSVGDTLGSYIALGSWVGPVGLRGVTVEVASQKTPTIYCSLADQVSVVGGDSLSLGDLGRGWTCRSRFEDLKS